MSHKPSTDFNASGTIVATMKEVRERTLQSEIDAGRAYEEDEKSNPGAYKCDPLIRAHLDAMLG